MFITFEGCEGTGKSTQSNLLFEYCKKNNIKAIQTREPGGTEVSEQIRSIIVKGEANKIDTFTELLLIYAARTHHFLNLIKPKLDTGYVVICDRFIDSTYAYQGYGKDFSFSILDQVLDLNIESYNLLMPDITFILDGVLNIGLNRAKNREKNNSNAEQRFENMDFTFHKKVKDGFINIANNNKDRCFLIDASKSKEDIHKDILSILQNKEMFIK